MLNHILYLWWSFLLKITERDLAIFKSHDRLWDDEDREWVKSLERRKINISKKLSECSQKRGKEWQY